MSRRMLIKDAAEALGVTKNYLYTEARAGRIPYIRAGKRYIFDVDQVEEFLKNKALENVRQEENHENIIQYGKLRRIQA